MVEIQAFGTSAGGEKVQWLVPDHLGAPRIIIDETGNRPNVKRHDYLPFGEELFAGTGGRTVGMGYAGDGVRQQFTGYERDVESGLDFAGARYYASTQGRFTSVDPLMASGTPANPQTLNRYSYVTNSPLTQIDPTGMFGISPGGSQLGAVGGMQLYSLSRESSIQTYAQELQQHQQQQQPENHELTLLHELLHAQHEEIYLPYLQFPVSGPGYYRFGRPEVGFGDQRMVLQLIDFAENWNRLHPGFDIAFGEMSNWRGETEDPHVSHVLGLKIDIRPMRTDGTHNPVTWTDPHYNRDLTRQLIQGLQGLRGYRSTLFNDPVLIREGLSFEHRGHHNHLHVSFTFPRGVLR